MPEWIAPALAALTLIAVLWLAVRRGDGDRTVRELRTEVQDSARATRQELAATLATFQQTLIAQQTAMSAQQGETVRTQNEQLDSFRVQLATLQQQVASSLQDTTHALARQGQGTQEAQAAALQRFGQQLVEQLRNLAQANERALEQTRQTVEQRLVALQADNEKKLEQMRATVDEKLSATLEQRLGESFRTVAEQLDRVQKGLGEMQNLARDVGALNRVLTNVKTRGTFGEVQLAALLEQVFTAEQYAANVETIPGSGARVEFAIRLPGPGGRDAPLWLPVDAKFPREDYERLLDAQERADKDAAEAAAAALERQLRLEAKTIRTKYVQAPHTTEFAILFLPTEGLYAEALRRPGLADALQRDHRVTLAGPTTLLATLTALQMGFRTLALEQRSAEVWDVLGAVKTEFGKFGDVLAKVKAQTATVMKTLDAAETRTRQMGRALKGVEALPEPRAQALLPADDAAPDDEDAVRG
jgi:DNA recombination protein RmuC